MIFNIPHTFYGDNDGERRVYEKLKNLFSGKKYFALHSVGLSKHKEKLKGECDFVLITDFGIYCLEVKGGPVKRILSIDRTDEIYPQKDLWIYATYEKEESPFKQAEGAIYPISKTLEENNYQKRNKFIIGSGVIFPDVEFIETSTEWDMREVCSKNQFENDFEGYLKELGKFYYDRLKSTKGIEVLKNLSADDLKWAIKCIRPNISHLSLVELNTSKNEIIQLEEKQKIFVDLLLNSNSTQAIIDGTPGTGKTIILLEAIQRISSNSKILLVCFNKQLSDYLSTKLFENKNVIVHSYHSLLETYCKKAGIIESSNKDRNYFENVLPQKYEEALIKLMETENLHRFDWLMIDEAQDFLNKNSFSNLTELLNKGPKGNIIISADSGIQSGVYKNLDYEFLDRLKKTMYPMPLNRNFRNPKNISNRAALIAGIEKPLVAREFNSFPKIYEIEKNNESIKQKLDEIVIKLLEKGVDPLEITILTFKNRKNSILSKLKEIGNIKLLDMRIINTWENKSKNFIPWSTVSSFKGLENEYIILIEAEIENYDNWYKSLLYVAMTRVKFEFICLVEKGSKIFEIITNRKLVDDKF